MLALITKGFKMSGIKGGTRDGERRLIAQAQWGRGVRGRVQALPSAPPSLTWPVRTTGTEPLFKQKHNMKKKANENCPIFFSWCTLHISVSLNMSFTKHLRFMENNVIRNIVDAMRRGGTCTKKTKHRRLAESLTEKTARGTRLYTAPYSSGPRLGPCMPHF